MARPLRIQAAGLTYHITARGVVVQSDGKPIVATRFVLSRFETDGSVDMGFAGDGDLELAIEIVGGAVYGSGPVVALQPDQKIVVVGASGSDLAVARYETDGDIDLTFGTAGHLASSAFGSRTSKMRRKAGVKHQSRSPQIRHAGRSRKESSATSMASSSA